MRKHTPAPWVVNIGQIDKEFLKGRLQEAVFHNDEPIAICGDNAANACLIAAAPDLLEALKDMLPFVINTCKSHIESRELWPEFVNKAKAAIAKAEGK